MFTGIVQACGRVTTIENRPFGKRLVIMPEDWRGCSPGHGDSICVSGVCLTVVSTDEQAWHFDVVTETLDRTSLRSIEPDSRVNLEPALTLSTPLGGHFVQGHIDGLGRIARIQSEESERRITIEPDSIDLPEGIGKLMSAIIPKGSVTVDGVSLTVAAVAKSSFEVALIPTTLQQTTLGDACEGDEVNLETDVISKTVIHWLERRIGNSSAVTMQTLQRAGFL